MQVTGRIGSQNFVINNRKECKCFIVSRFHSGNTHRQIYIKSQRCLTTHWLDFNLAATLCDTCVLTNKKHKETKLRYYINCKAYLPPGKAWEQVGHMKSSTISISTSSKVTQMHSKPTNISNRSEITTAATAASLKRLTNEKQTTQEQTDRNCRSHCTLSHLRNKDVSEKPNNTIANLVMSTREVLQPRGLLPLLFL
jgi:hypothetical protein